MKVKIAFYSMYGHIYKMAEAVAEGAREVLSHVPFAKSADSEGDAN